MAFWLPVIWAGLIAVAVLAYVLLDGFDLGVGILFGVEHDEADRDLMVNSIAPVWDGNETWLILGGGGLFAVFPKAYGIVMPAFYPLIISMLMALMFRGVAFEFRFRAVRPASRRWWDRAFLAGSLVAALCQGMVLGGLLQGVRVAHGQYAGGWFDWATPFTLLCGIAVVTGYALLGATWLIWRVEGRLQRAMRRHASRLGLAVLALILVVSLWTPLLNPVFRHRWFDFPGILLTSPVPLLVALAAWGFWRGLRREAEVAPFLYAIAWFVLSYAGLGISLWPMMVPPSVSIWQAAAPPASQGFLLVGAAVLLPVILGYTGFAYWVFRGKVRPGEGYH